MKKGKIIALGIALIVMILIGGIIYYQSVVKSPFDKAREEVEIQVGKGEGINTLLDKLDEQGILRCKIALKIKIKLDDIKPVLIEGTYKLDSSSSFEQFLDTIQTEDKSINDIMITIPEGYNIDDMANEFEKKGLFNKEQFIEAVKNYPLPSYIEKDDKRKYQLEGYLYPNTYKFKKDSTPEDVIKTLNEQFDKVIAEVRNEVNFSDEDMNTIITKASLIEKEVKLEKEKTTVASVIENRLAKNMKLEFCSTIHYIIGYEGHETLYYKDLDVESPYNTYKYKGLPVGPITTPTKGSILAVLNPEKTEYLFFLTKDDNSHIFSKTGEEHEALKNKK